MFGCLIIWDHLIPHNVSLKSNSKSVARMKMIVLEKFTFGELGLLVSSLKGGSCP